MGCIGTKMECYGYSQVMATAVADRCEVRTLLIDVVHLNGFVAALSYAHVCAIVRHATCIGLSARSCGPSCNSLTHLVHALQRAPHCALTSANAIPHARETCRAERHKCNGLRCVAFAQPVGLVEWIAALQSLQATNNNAKRRASHSV